MNTTRREFIKTVGVAGAATFLPWSGGVRRVRAESLPGSTLDPNLIPKYVTPLVIPPAMPRTGNFVPKPGHGLDDADASGAKMSPVGLRAQRMDRPLITMKLPSGSFARRSSPRVCL